MKPEASLGDMLEMRSQQAERALLWVQMQISWIQLKKKKCSLRSGSRSEMQKLGLLHRVHDLKLRKSSQGLHQHKLYIINKHTAHSSQTLLHIGVGRRQKNTELMCLLKPLCALRCSKQAPFKENNKSVSCDLTTVSAMCLVPVANLLTASNRDEN